MDLGLYLRVISRFRVLVISGLVFAIALAFFSFVRIEIRDSRPAFTYREEEEWVSTATLLITQQGFPWGRSVVDPDAPRPKSNVGEDDLRFADPGRFSSLAVLYSHLAEGDEVREVMRRDGPVRGEVDATPVVSEAGFGEALPLVQVSAYASSREGAIALAQRVTAAFRQFLDTEQDTNAIPPDERVVVNVVKQPRKAELFQGRSKTIPVVVFTTVMIAVMGLAFILENLRPRVGVIRERTQAEAKASSARRSA